MEVTPTVVAGILAGIVMLVFLFASGKSAPPAVSTSKSVPPPQENSGGGKNKEKNQRRKAKKAAAAAPEQPIAAAEEPANGKKKKKKKKAKVAEQPEPEPEPVVVEEPVVVVSKKKKKKKAKSTAAVVTETPEPVVVEPPAATNGKKKKNKKKTAEPVKEQKEPMDSDDDDDDDDGLLAFAIGGRSQANNQKKPAAATNGSDDGGWSTISRNGKSAKASAATTAAGGGPTALTITLTPKEVPLLIGPKGATIQNIQSTTGAKLDVDKSFGDDFVKVTGEPAQIASAQAAIRSLLNHSAAQKAHTVTLSGSAIKGSDGIKAIIGRAGTTIQKIQATSGCTLQASIDEGKVVIAGPSAAAVATAQTLCKNAVFGADNATIDLGSRGMVNCVAGRNFSRMQPMQVESGARLDIERGGTTMTISGEVENVATAKRLVLARMEFCKGIVVELESGKIGALYGKGGTNLRKIQDTTGASVEVVQMGSTAECKILGEPDAVKEAKALVLKSLSGEVQLGPGEVLANVELGVGVSAVIGRGGSKIAELEQTHGVKINIQSTACTIVGKKDAVAGAKEAIETIVTPLIEKAAAEAKVNEQAQQMAANGDDTWGAAPADAGGAWEATADDADGW